MKIIIDIPNSRDGRFKSWAKQLTGVDITKKDGYAFKGVFLKLGRKEELETGSLVLFYLEAGSAKYHDPKVTVCKVTDEGTFEELISTKGKSWALDIRDKTAKLFEIDYEYDMLVARKAELEFELEKVTKAICNLSQENIEECVT